jgi:hypothetical protein
LEQILPGTFQSIIHRSGREGILNFIFGAAFATEYILNIPCSKLLLIDSILNIFQQRFLAYDILVLGVNPLARIVRDGAFSSGFVPFTAGDFIHTLIQGKMNIIYG